MSPQEGTGCHENYIHYIKWIIFMKWVSIHTQNIDMPMLMKIFRKLGLKHSELLNWK